MRYFDLHCDTITECYLNNKRLNKNGLHISLEKTKEYKPWAQVFAAWIPDSLRGRAAYDRFEACAACLKREIEENADYIKFCKNGNDLKSAIAKGRNAAVLSIEGGAALEGKLERLYDVYEAGVRLMTLTWNEANEIGDGCRQDNAGGLRPFGREVVREMARLSMIIDVAHLSEKGFYDVAQQTDKPFIASHSNAFSQCGNARNLRDEQIREIIRRGGLIGINLYPRFIKDCETVTMRDIIPHVEHILSLGGENVLAVGGDFDGAEMPEDVRGIEDIKGLSGILGEYYDSALLDKIFFSNAYEYFSGL